MIQLLRSLFSATPREYPLKKLAPTGGSVQLNTAGDYRAVSLEPCPKCPAAAKYSPNKRYLLRDMPRVPLATCAMPASCSCRYHKYADRRDGDRRLLGEVTTNRWYGGSERRDPKRRRSADH